MARTFLFKSLRRAMLQSGAIGPRALSRRTFLAMAAAAAACQQRAAGDVAIIGAGAAGLTAAYRLLAAGRAVTLYEASTRLGGRMFTRRSFNEDGQFCELGGELVDTNHTALRDLCAELGVEVQRIAPENGQEFYHINNRLYAQQDMIGADGQGAFARLAPRIAEDQAKLLDAEENWTEHARALDQTSLADYLAGISNLAPGWAMEVLDIAYRGEFGLETRHQSALNLVDFISTETAEGFHVFGDSDEAFRIAGGSSSLPEALAQRIGEGPLRLGHALTAIALGGAGVRLSFDSPQGAVTREHAQVILALPFTKLRQVQGIDALGLDAEQLRAIRELGYGDNSKLMLSTRARPWLIQRWPAPSAGVFYSDRFQLAWDTSRGQTGGRGVLTNFLQGVDSRDAALAAFTQGLRRISPTGADALETANPAFMVWKNHAFTQGAYSAPRVGQYTTLLDTIAAPSPDGRVHFAGEHASVDFQGFMNGAVESGERAAAALLA
ncbi:MAG TPA: NAD(P)/FAD-dependent oxidoreductase [Terricaulis sp.]|nr:NAD(P)/FAD-dependent oxidoreductase [Terricaulis sp.]